MATNGAAKFETPDTVVDCSWGEVFAAAAREVPQSPFLVSWSSRKNGLLEEITFSEYYGRAVGVAEKLCSLGATEGSAIALLSHPSVQLYVACGGVLLLGGICVKLNWRQPPAVLARAICLTTKANFLVHSTTMRKIADDLESSAKEQKFSLSYVRLELGSEAGMLDTSIMSRRTTEWNPKRASNSTALIMFSSGSTGAPKAIPITHAGSLWACRTKLDAHGGLANVQPSGTLSFLPNFHVIGLINNFLFNALCRIPSYVHAEAEQGLLTAEVFARAASELRPCAIDTVPAILEALGRSVLETENLKDRQAMVKAFAQAHIVSCGGAPLSSAAYDILKEMGVNVVPHYGQTELGGGFCLMGTHGSGRDLMRPVRGVVAVLVDESMAAERTPLQLSRDNAAAISAANGGMIIGNANRGELAVVGCGSATPGYVGLEPPLVPFNEWRQTGDVFERVTAPDGLPALRHCCRRDDVIVHATGELTNPIPIEDAALRALHGVATRVCVVGQRRPSPIMFIEKTNSDVQIDSKLLSHVLSLANATAPAYSRIASSRVIVVDNGKLPVSGKGNVIRSALERAFQEEMDFMDKELAELEQALNQHHQNQNGISKKEYKNGSASSAHKYTTLPEEKVRSIVITAAAELIGDENIQTDAPLLSVGLNSTGLVQLVRLLAKQLNLELKPTLIFDHPSIDAIVDFVTGKNQLDANLLSAPIIRSSGPIVIKSRILRSPGAVESPLDLARRSALKIDTVSTIPMRKWDVDAVDTTRDQLPKHAALAVRYGAFLDASVENYFDNDFFRTKHVEVASMDPQQRLLMDVGYEALKGAGYNRKSLADANVGTFTACMNMDAPALAPKNHDLNAYVMMGSGYSALGARVSYAFAMNGPCLVFDTACSSSLIAAHVAARCLYNQECADALIVAPNLMLLPGFQHLGTAIMGMNSPRGRCHTFDDRADGFVRGEGAAAIVVGFAEHGDDDEEATALHFRGSAAKHNGRSASFTALNGLSQTLLIRAGLRDAGVESGAHISYLEAHGTGTPIGDPIEVSGASTVLCGDDRKVPLRIGGVKSSSGHAEGAAGLTGLIAATVALTSRFAPPSTLLRRLNPQVRDIAPLKPFCLISPDTEVAPLTPTNPATPFTAACSSFGWSGIIAHGIIEQVAATSAIIEDFEATDMMTSLPRLAVYHNRKRVQRLGGRGPPRPMLHNVVSEDSQVFVAETRVVGHLLEALKDHIIGGKCLLPGVASIECALSSVLRKFGADAKPVITSSLDDITFARPCVLYPNDPMKERVLSITIRGNDEPIIEIASWMRKNPEARTVHVLGRVRLDEEDTILDESMPPSLPISCMADRRSPLAAYTKARLRWPVKRKRMPLSIAPDSKKVFVPASVNGVRLKLSAKKEGQMGRMAWARDKILLSTDVEQSVDATLIEDGSINFKLASLRTRPILSLSGPKLSPAADVVLHQGIGYSAQDDDDNTFWLRIPVGDAAVPDSALVTFDLDEHGRSGTKVARRHFNVDTWIHVVPPSYDDDTYSGLVILNADQARSRAIITDAASADTSTSLEYEYVRLSTPGKTCGQSHNVVFIDAGFTIGLQAAIRVLDSANLVVVALPSDQIPSSDLPALLQLQKEENSKIMFLSGTDEIPTQDFFDFIFEVAGGDGSFSLVEARIATVKRSGAFKNLGLDGRKCRARVVYTSLETAAAPSKYRSRGQAYLAVRTPSTVQNFRAGLLDASTVSAQSEIVNAAQSSLGAKQSRKENEVSKPGLVQAKTRTASTKKVAKSKDNKGKSMVLKTVREIASSLAGVTVENDSALMSAGIDSLAATELSQTLSKKFSVELGSTLLFDYPTPNEIAGLIASKLESIADGPVAAVEEEVLEVPPSLGLPVESSLEASVCIAAVGCRLPISRSLDDLRELTARGLDAGMTVPLARWDASKLDTDLSPEVAARSKYGVFLDGVGELDADFFRVKPLEANTLDPQQKLVLEVGYAMLKDAGKTRESLAGSLTGVFLGAMNMDSNEMLPPVHNLSPFDLTGNGYSAAAARLSYVFAMKGPAQSVDTACSSTLVAAHAARHALRTGEANDAVVLGPNLHLHPGVSMIGGAIAGMNSMRGRCHTLDSRADGYLRAEACGGAVLTLARSAEDEDDTKALLITPGQQCIIAGMALRHNGRAASFTALNGVAQRDLIEAAIVNAGIRPKDVGFLEMHGTGTALGDPVECAAPSQLYAQDRDPRDGLALAGVKANFGHTESSAGIAGVLKALVLLADADIGRNAQLRIINPKVKGVIADGTRCSVEPSPRVDKDIGGVSSFGFSGIIGHAVLRKKEINDGSINGIVPDRVGAPMQQPPVSYLQFDYQSNTTSIALYRKSIKFRFNTKPDHALCSADAADKATAAASFENNVLAKRIPSSPSWTVETTLSPSLVAIMADHRVNGRSLFAGVGLVEMAFAAAIAKKRSVVNTVSPFVRLDNAVFLRPCPLSEIVLSGSSKLTLACEIASDGTLEIYNYTTEGKAESSAASVVFSAVGVTFKNHRDGIFPHRRRKPSLRSEAMRAARSLPTRKLATDAVRSLVTRKKPVTKTQVPGDVIEEYTLVPASIESISMDCTSFAHLGERSAPSGRDMRPASTYWSKFVQQYATSNEERCTASMRRVSETEWSYSINSLCVKATGPPRKKVVRQPDVPNDAVAYEPAWQVSRDAYPKLEYRTVRVNGIDYVYRTLSDYDRVAVVFIPQSGKPRYLTEPPEKPASYLGVLFEAKPRNDSFWRNRLPCIHATSLAALFEATAVFNSEVSSTSIGMDRATRLKQLESVALLSVRPVANSLEILDLQPIEQYNLKIQKERRHVECKGSILVLGSSKLGLLAMTTSWIPRDRVAIIATDFSRIPSHQIAGLRERCNDANAYITTKPETTDDFCALATLGRRLSGVNDIVIIDDSNADISPIVSTGSQVVRIAFQAADLISFSTGPALLGSTTSDKSFFNGIAKSTVIATPPRQAIGTVAEKRLNGAISMARDDLSFIDMGIEFLRNALGERGVVSSGTLLSSAFEGLEAKVTEMPKSHKKQTTAPKHLKAAASKTASISKAAPVVSAGPTKAGVLEIVTNAATALTGVQPAANDPLMSSGGFDSLVTTDFVKKLGIEFDFEVPTSLLFDHPTLDAIATFLTGELSKRAPQQAVPTVVEEVKEIVMERNPAPRQRKRPMARTTIAPTPVQQQTPVLTARDKSTLISTLTGIVQSLVGTTPAPTEPLMSAGFDSLVTNDFNKKVSVEFDFEVPSTMLFDHPTIDSIADYLNNTLAPVATTVTKDVVAVPLTQQPIAPVATPIFDDAEEFNSYEYLGDSDVGGWSHADLTVSQSCLGQVGIFAGASRGIGRAVAIAMAKRGVHCAIFGQSTVREVAEACKQAGPPGTRAIGIKVDLRDKSKVIEAVDKVRAEFGDRIDILVQSASVHRGGDLREIDERGFDFVQRTNVLGTSFIAHVCLPYLRRSPKPQILFIAPSAISARSFLNFSRGSAIYASAKLMMGFYLKLWKKAFPGISMVSLWPKYVVSSLATQGNNQSLAANELDMVKPIYIGEAAALAMSRPAPTNRLHARADYYLDADIHIAMQTGRAHTDFTIVDSRPWHELEVCFQVEVLKNSDIVPAFDVAVPENEVCEVDVDKRLYVKILIVGAFHMTLGDPADVAILNIDSGNFESINDGYRRFVAKSPADCGSALDEALEYLGGVADIVLFACDTTVDGIPHDASASVDLPMMQDRLVKFPFFVCKELKLRRDTFPMPPKIAFASPPPDTFPLANTNILLNEVLLFRSLVALAIAVEFDKEGPPNPSVRLYWTDSQPEFTKCDENFRGILPKTLSGIATMNRSILVTSVITPTRLATPPASCTVLRAITKEQCDYFRPKLAVHMMSGAYDTFKCYDSFPEAKNREYWFDNPAAPAKPSRRFLTLTETDLSTPSILGLRCALPSFATTGRNNAEELRHFANNCGVAVSTVPRGRWDTPVPGAEQSALYGGFLADPLCADFECAGMVAVEARYCDPQQLMVLEAACGSLHDAYSTSSKFDRQFIVGENIGVYMACGGVTYGSGGLASVSSLKKDDKPTLYTGTSSALSVVAGRIPFVLGLTGPCLSIDTACCSSLVAAHVATKALAAGECDAALAATVGLLSEPASTAFSIAGMLSPTGRCFSFDKAANGYVRGEGCVSFVLDAGSRRRHTAIENDPTGLTTTPPGILGSSVQQDGISASLTAPNGTAQRKLISAVSSDGVDEHAWSTLEAHGTGTALGDPIEIGAASSVLCAPLPGSAIKRSARCTSFKANVGHLEGAAAAAGMVALFSTSLCGGSLGAMPPNALLRQLNGHLGTFVKTNQFYLPVGEPLLASSSQDGPHTARLSSFGFSGTIAHARFEAGDRAAAIVEQYASERKPELFRSKVALPLVSRIPRGRVKMQASASSRILTNAGALHMNQIENGFADYEEDDDESIEHQAVDVAAIVNDILGFEVDVQKPLMDVGLDSFVAGELMNQLSAAAKADLPATLLFDYPSVASLDKYMRSDEMILASTTENDERAERRRRRAEKRQSRQMQVPAAVGPGGSSRPRRALRPQILIGRDARTPIATTSSSLLDLCAAHANKWSAVSSMPASRFDEDFAAREKYPIAATYGGFVSVNEIECFANETFSLSRAESSAMDPQQRLALEVGHSVLLGEGNYNMNDLVDANIGCYVGIQTSDFFDLARRPTSGVSQTYLATGANHAVASGRIPYTFGLRGASMAITTACSTALVCCHEARAGLEVSSSSNAALIVAVNLNLLGAMTANVAKAGMLSPRGNCHTLDERADGYVRSEGCVGILLRLEEEEKMHPCDVCWSSDGSTVVAGTAVRSDGKSASLTAPSGLAQQQLLREALHDATLSRLGKNTDDSTPLGLSHIELHGTGTALGDPIEIGALTALGPRGQAHTAPTLAAIKANVGHSETCSGAFGLAVLSNLALVSQRAAPQACLRQLNSRLTHFAERFIGPVEQTPRNDIHGGVSSFGFSGAIAHIQLDRDMSSKVCKDKEYLDDVARIGISADDYARPLTSLIAEHQLAIRRSSSRFPLVESRAPTPAVQQESANANVKAIIEAKRLAEEGDGDTRPVLAYEVQWAPKPLAPKCKTYSETKPETRTVDDIDGKYSWPQADGMQTSIEDTSRLALIIGAGLDGVLCAAAFARNDIQYVLYEKNNFMAGVWVTQANATSKVQTGKLTYTLDLEDQSPDVALESNFQPADEVCLRITEFAMRMGVDKRTYTKREVLGVRHGTRHDENFVTWRDLSKADSPVVETKFAAVIFACGALRAPTLAPVLAGASTYRGFDSYGVAADMAPSEMAGRDIVIAGHGAYGVENVRTGLEHGAKSITVICRHRHSVLPRCAVWTLDAGRDFDAWTEISEMLSLAKLGHAYTTDRRKRPAVSDQYYVAMRYGRANVIHGQITGFDVDPRTNKPTVVIDNTLRVPADISLLCYGFSKQTTFINELMGVEELTGIWVNGRRTLAILKGDLDVRREATPLSASNIPYASFLANVIAQFLKQPQDFEKLLPRFPKADKNQDTTSFDFFASVFLTLISNQDVKPHFDKLVRRVQHTSVRDVMPWDTFIRDCTADWRRYVAVCNSGGSDDIPYHDWPERHVPEHREGFGLKKDEKSVDKPASNWIAVIDGSNMATPSYDDESLISGVGDTWTPPTRRPAAMLCVTFPKDLSSLATLMRYAATNGHTKSTLIVLSNKAATPFLAQIRVARVELPKFKISSVTVDPAFPPSPGMIENLLTRNGPGFDIRIGPEPCELVPTLSSWKEHRTTAVNKVNAVRGGRALVTGGTGALGLVTSSLLLESGLASFVVIATRQPRVKLLADPLVPRLQKLAQSGRAIVVTGADTSDPEAMRNLVRLVDAGAPPFYDAQNENASSGGALVVHTAGVLHDVMLTGMERWMADKVFKPKVNCLPAIASLIESSDRGRAVFFSSATVVLGGPGQTAYSAASGHLDEFAQNERLRGVYASTVQWLAVQGVGMHQEAVGSAPQWTSLRRVEEVIAHVSLGTYSPKFTSLRPPPASVTIMPEAFLKFLPQQVDLDVKDDPKLKPQPVKEQTRTKRKAKGKSTKKEKKPQSTDALATVNTAIKATLATIVENHDDSKDDVPFMEMGVDSMGLTDFVNSLNEKLGVELPEVALFEYPTVQELRTALVEMISAKLGGVVEEDEDEEFEIVDEFEEYESPMAGPRTMTIRKAPRIAIASICGKLGLGDVSNGEFMQGVRLGSVAVGRLPLDRVHSSLLNEPAFPEASQRMHRGVSVTDNDALQALNLPETARYGGFIATSEWTHFDNEAFGIGSAEAKVMDPQQRQLLEVGYEALVAAGLNKAGIRAYAEQGRSIGNFVALQTNDFARAIVRTPKLVASTYAVSGANPAIAAGRLGYALGLRGAALCVDTACSTALVCLHEARLSFYETPDEPALVSAVNAMIDASVTEVVERAGMLSPRGRCHTFDSRADGYTRGEGIVSVVLRPVTEEDAEDVANSSLGSVGMELASTSLRSDGKTASITAPSGTAQRELLLRAKQSSAPLHNEDIIMAVECHGTGTALGDPIEIGALATHFDKYEPARDGLNVSLAGVKASLGHLEPAAGFAGLAALLALANDETAPNPQLRTLNRQLDSALVTSHKNRQLVAGVDSGMPLAQRRKELENGACVSSFGFSGIISNARIAFVEPYNKAYQGIEGRDLLSVKPALYRKRVNYQWLEVVEPLVYGIDAHARAAPAQVGLMNSSSSTAMQERGRKDMSYEEILKTVRSIVSSLGGEGGDDDEFTDMGVDSIASTELSRALAAEFDLGKLSPTFVFENPTISLAAMAISALLRDAAASSSSHTNGVTKGAASDWLVPFAPHRRTHRAALFMWSGGQGDASAFARLGARLGDDVRVFGVDREPGATVGQMANSLAPQIAACIPDNDTACYLGGLSVGGWLAVETAVRLERDHGKKAARIFSIDGPSPKQFRYDCVYEPHVGAAELLKGRGVEFPAGWSKMTSETKLNAFIDLLPSLGIDFIGRERGSNQPSFATRVAEDLSRGAADFMATLRDGEYNPDTTSLPSTEIVAFRAAERDEVMMLNDDDADPYPHIYSWANENMPNLRVIDLPTNHMHLLTHDYLLDVIAAVIRANVDSRNRPS